uniref:Attractin n=1 Tax=Panagrolaimus sp. PS1159 TaxID=55785 RepID=A0AC35GR58_9BILA
MSLNDGAKKTTAITQLSSYLFISFLHYYLLFLLNTTFQTTNAILQTQRGLIPSKSQIPCVQGQFINNRCVCPPGWTGPFCEHCFGRVRYNSSILNFSDGKRNYTASSRCTWIIEDDAKTDPLLLDISHFMTECCWDHFYVYDGDSVNNNLIAVLSGRQSARQITVPSGKAIVYFVTYNLEGFEVNYNWDKCPNDCSGNGSCINGYCKCNEGFVGNSCEFPICTNKSTNTNNNPCIHGSCNNETECECSKGFHGDFCQADTWKYVWDTVLSKNTEEFTARASHTIATNKNNAYIYGGYYFKEKFNQDLLSYNFDDKTFTYLNSNNPPPSRYDHSMVYYNDSLYVFGGVIDNITITNELLKYNINTNTWEYLKPHDDEPSSLPRAVAGHTAHVLNDKMYVFFGYNPYEGFYHQVQIYDFRKDNWTLGRESDIVGRFGHSSSISFNPNPKETMIYIYGGYNQASQEAAYNISDELLVYNPEKEDWEPPLIPGGTRLFRHSATIADQYLIITGGNSHNESTSVRDSECFSSKVLVYDIACKQWITDAIITNSKYANVNRYGHSSATYNDNVYIFGGFNGMMLNDVIKLTLGDCDQTAQTVESCEGRKDGYRCKLFNNKNCIRVDHSVSYRQNFLTLIKSEFSRSNVFNCPGISNQGLQCSVLKECQTCFGQRSCGWCESTSQCVNSDTGCPDGSAITSDEHSCPIKDKSILFPVKKRQCNMATNCYACRQMTHCSWFTIETRPSCISQEDEAVLVEQHNRIQSERLASLAHSMQPSSRTIADFRYLQTFNATNATCPSPCSSFTHCQNCTQSNCMWCPSKRRCVSMDTYMISFPYGQCESWITQANSHNNRACELDPNDCSLQKTCDECQQIGPRCGWCDDGNGTGLGKCLPGSLKSPKDPSKCDDKHWYFTGQPECQCNGHSNCSSTRLISQLGTDTKSCNRCLDDTAGEHCERCADGYFGDPRNGGNCTKCECHDQAQSCDNEKGYCFCTTKGVIGDHCDTCDTKYEGDPKINKPCSYKLAIDFIFTFKLDNNEDKDKYVNQINFFAVPFKHDTDVQFSISCDGLVDAHVDVAVTSAYDDGDRPNKILSNYTCNSHGFKKTWSPTDSRFHLYPFGADSNTTFHVKVYNFSTPIKIQISFAQSPPINWILFFVIFAACFVVLLVIAGLVWVIKQRVERYHQIQATHVEIERMASRPFASVQLDLSSKQYESATPISIEPCSNYQSGIYTLIVRLPTGGQNYTPHGTSGLAVASSLCSLTQSQLALLQPPDSDNQQAGQKSSLRRFISFKNPFASNT